jgi:hypothetical protein
VGTSGDMCVFKRLLGQTRVIRSSREGVRLLFSYSVYHLERFFLSYTLSLTCLAFAVGCGSSQDGPGRYGDRKRIYEQVIDAPKYKLQEVGKA